MCIYNGNGYAARGPAGFVRSTLTMRIFCIGRVSTRSVIREKRHENPSEKYPDFNHLPRHGENDLHPKILQRSFRDFPRELLAGTTFRRIEGCTSSAPIINIQQVHALHSHCADRCTKLPRKIPAFQSVAPIQYEHRSLYCPPVCFMAKRNQ